MFYILISVIVAYHAKDIQHGRRPYHWQLMYYISIINFTEHIDIT